MPALSELELRVRAEARRQEFRIPGRVGGRTDPPVAMACIRVGSWGAHVVGVLGTRANLRPSPLRFNVSLMCSPSVKLVRHFFTLLQSYHPVVAKEVLRLAAQCAQARHAQASLLYAVLPHLAYLSAFESVLKGKRDTLVPPSGGR